MNGREKVAVVILTVTFLLGAVLGWARRSVLAEHSARSPVAVVADTMAPLAAASPGEPPSIIDINVASARELEALPGIGPVLAARIVEYRNRVGGFGGVEELRRVSGIGPKRYADIRALATVGKWPSVESAR